MILLSILRLIREYIRYNTFIQNPNPRPDPRIFKKIRPNPSTYKILRSVTTLLNVLWVRCQFEGFTFFFDFLTWQHADTAVEHRATLR